MNDEINPEPNISNNTDKVTYNQHGELPYLGIYFTDPLGNPIDGLKYQLVTNKGKQEGTTDDNGVGEPVSMKPGTPFQIQVITDKGEPKTLASMTMPGRDATLNARSPCLKVPIETELHEQGSGTGTKTPDQNQSSPPPTTTSTTPTSPSTTSPTQTSSASASSTQTSPQQSVSSSGSKDSSKTSSPASNDKTSAKSAPPSSSGKGSSKPASSSAGSSDKKATVEDKRSEKGHPIAEIKPPKASGMTFKEMLISSLWSNPQTTGVAAYLTSSGNKTSSGSKGSTKQAGTEELQKLWKMIHFARIQCEWLYTQVTKKTKQKGKGEDGKPLPDIEKLVDRTSDDIYRQLVSKRDDYIVTADNKISMPSIAESKEASKPNKSCYKYVKIALAMGEYSGEDKKLGNIQLHKVYGGIPARLAGEQLEGDGWSNIAESLKYNPLIAAPGDIIVYGESAYTCVIDEETQSINVNRTYKTGDRDYGHIDIRTYDGFISDFWTPNPAKQTSRPVISIWRKSKHFDPYPIYRMRAFLRVIESREAPGNPEALNIALPNKLSFKHSKYHPWFGVFPKPPSKNPVTDAPQSTAAGRYQIVLTTWKEYLENGRIPADFSNDTQVVIACYEMNSKSTGEGENRRTALAMIREGGDHQIMQAATLLKPKWTSLPTKDKPVGSEKYKNLYTMNNLLDDYHKYLDEETSKGV